MLDCGTAGTLVALANSAELMGRVPIERSQRVLAISAPVGDPD